MGVVGSRGEGGSGRVEKGVVRGRWGLVGKRARGGPEVSAVGRGGVGGVGPLAGRLRGGKGGGDTRSIITGEQQDAVLLQHTTCQVTESMLG